MTRTSLYLRNPEQLKALDQLADDVKAVGQRGASRNVMAQNIATAYEKDEYKTMLLMDAIMRIGRGEDVSERYSLILKVDQVSKLEREVF